MGDDKQDSADGMRNGRWQWALCQPAEFRPSGFGGSARRQAWPMHVRCVAVGATLALEFSADELAPAPAPGFFAHPVRFLICRYTALNRSVWQPVESLVYYLLFPVLLFQ